MNRTPVVVQGTLKADGTLELSQPVGLPPGPVEVTVTPVAPREGTWAVLQRIWEDQKVRGHVPRTVEQVEAERQSQREEWDARDERLSRARWGDEPAGPGSAPAEGSPP